MSGGVGFGNFTYAPEATTAARNNDFYVLSSEPEPAAVSQIVAGNASITVSPAGGTGVVTLTVPPPIFPPSEFAPGMVMMYSTLAAPPVAPTGWLICNGQPGTPDLRDRFIIGAGLSWSVTQTGGAASVALTLDMLPDHIHDTNGSVNSQNAATTTGSGFSTCNPTGVTTGIKGGWTGGIAVPTVPPFYALFYIIKT
jgi:hypothetical protein